MKVSSLLVSLIWLSARCQIPLTADLGKYLGVPLIHKRVSKTTYYHILEKVQDRLAGRKDLRRKGNNLCANPKHCHYGPSCLNKISSLRERS